MLTYQTCWTSTRYSSNEDETQSQGAPADPPYAGLSLASMDGAVNIDGFEFAVMHEARERRHTSIIMHQVGVPTKRRGGG
jgi:hypothetical protein